VDLSLGYAVMASSSAECYRSRAKDCCRKAVIAEDIDQRTHWLEAAARWVSLARQEGILLPAQTKAAPSSDPVVCIAAGYGS
jgi:predicted dienelactone hydrolase